VILTSVVGMVRADCPVGQYNDGSGCQYCPVGQTTTDGTATSVGDCSTPTPDVEISLKFECYLFQSNYNLSCWENNYLYDGNFQLWIHDDSTIIQRITIDKNRDFNGTAPVHGDIGNEIIFNLQPGSYKVRLNSYNYYYDWRSSPRDYRADIQGGWRDNRAVISFQETEQAYSWRPYSQADFDHVPFGRKYKSRVNNDSTTEITGDQYTPYLQTHYADISSADMALNVSSSECPKGQYGTPSNGCQTCSNGTTTEGAGALFDYDCVQCIPPQVISGRDCITICPAGYVPDGTTCQQCAEGTYRTSGMDECAANTDFKKGINEFRNDTVACALGQDSSRSAGATCQQCAEGTYRTSDMDECDTCGTGTKPDIQCYGDDVILNEWQRRHGTC